MEAPQANTSIAEEKQGKDSPKRSSEAEDSNDALMSPMPPHRTSSDDSNHSSSSPIISSPDPAEDGADDDDPRSSKRVNLRESLRARLRAQEARLQGLVRNASGDGLNSVIGQMKTVRESLQQVAAEKSELEKELARLKNATDDDDFLKEKMTGIQEGFEKQVKKIQSLQETVNEKEDEIECLRLQLVKKLQRIVELEFDLETHEIHYTNYAAEQFKLGEDALNEIKAQKSSDNPQGESSQAPAADDGTKKITAKKAQKLISKLLWDLDNLELRYKEERVKAASALEKVSLENEELRTKVEVLRKQIGDASEQSDTGDDEKNVFDAYTITHLRKLLDVAEARKTLFRKEASHLRDELEECKKEAESDGKRIKLEIDALKDENEALLARIAQLEAKQGGGLLKKKKKEDHADKFAILQLQIEENYKERCRLEAALEIKDKQISTLKKEVANLRLRDISDGNTKDTIYTEFDTNLLRTSPNRPRSSFLSSDIKQGEGDDSAYVVELQRQLHEAQHQLVKKDQELVIERAKAASTAAGLLARITELTGKKVEGKQKQVPLRFYL